MKGNVGRYRNTKIFTEEGKTIVRLYGTRIVEWNENEIILNHGGYASALTKRRMNEVAEEYGLGFEVWQKHYDWFVDYKGKSFPYANRMVLERKEVSMS